MIVEVFGPGCARCKQTVKIVEIALDQLGGAAAGDIQVRKIEDMRIAAQRGVLSTPAVAVDGRLVSQGKVPTVDEAKGWLQGA